MVNAVGSDARLYPPIAALRAFEAVARLGGIRRAARELVVDHAVVSRHVRSLEHWVGVSLVDRDSTSKLTLHGEEYFKEISYALSAIAKASRRLIVDEREHDLRLGCEVNFGSLWLSKHLPDFIVDNPDINVHLHTYVDFADMDLSAKHTDCNIAFLQYAKLASLPHYLRREEIIAEENYPVASRECADKLRIGTARDALDWPFLHVHDDDAWRIWLRAQGIEVGGRLGGKRLGQLDVMIQAAKRSHGVALACDMLADTDLEAGHLVKIAPREGAFKPVYMGGFNLLAHEERWNSPAVDRFRRWLRASVTSL